jgi:hypothetical protein
MSASYADRRSELKGRVLGGLSVFVTGGAVEVFYEDGNDLGFDDDAVDAVLNEIAGELYRRSERLRRPGGA